MNKKIIFATILVIILLVIALLMNKKDAEKEIVNNPDVSANQVAMCYSYAKENSRGLQDRALLKMDIKGEYVTGEYQNLPAESDSKIGTFEGFVGAMNPATSGRIADVWWNSFAEGMHVTEQLHVSFGEGSAVALFGEMMDRGDGVYVYKNPNSLTGGFQMSQVDCDTLDKNVSSGSVVETEEDINVVTPSPLEGEMVACTMDAMMCPDGSYVGRVGPNCAFQACPGSVN